MVLKIKSLLYKILNYLIVISFFVALINLLINVLLTKYFGYVIGLPYFLFYLFDHVYFLKFIMFSLLSLTLLFIQFLLKRSYL